MKHRILLAAVTLCVALVPAARAELDVSTVDLSGLSSAELVILKNKVNVAIWESGDWKQVTIQPGVWKVGEEIPAGHYHVTAAEGDAIKFRYGDTLSAGKTAVTYSSNAYISESLFHPSAKSYRPGSATSVNVDMQEGCYVDVSLGCAVLSPYTGAEFAFSSEELTMPPAATPTPKPTRRPTPSPTPKPKATKTPAPTATPKKAAQSSSSKTKATDKRGAFEFCYLSQYRLSESESLFGTGYEIQSSEAESFSSAFAETWNALADDGQYYADLLLGDAYLSLPYFEIEKIQMPFYDNSADHTSSKPSREIIRTLIGLSVLEYDDTDASMNEILQDSFPSQYDSMYVDCANIMSDMTKHMVDAVAESRTTNSEYGVLVYSGNYDYYLQYINSGSVDEYLLNAVAR